MDSFDDSSAETEEVAKKSSAVLTTHKADIQEASQHTVDDVAGPASLASSSSMSGIALLTQVAQHQ